MAEISGRLQHGEIETYHPGYLGAQDTYYVGNSKGIGHIYQQTFIDTYAKVAFTKLYDRKNALVAAEMLNDEVVPFFEQHDLLLLRILTDRGTEYCGIKEQHEYQLYLAIEDIDHSKTKAKSPQTNGICERFHRTIQDEFYAIAFRKKVYRNIIELQADLDRWMDYYNNERTHSGKYCFGKTPMQTFTDSIPLAKAKLLEYLAEDQFVPHSSAGSNPEANAKLPIDQSEEKLTSLKKINYVHKAHQTIPKKSTSVRSNSGYYIISYIIRYNIHFNCIRFYT